MHQNAGALQMLAPGARSRRRRGAIIAGVALGLGIAAADWNWHVRPQLADVRKRHETVLDIATLYSLQLSYKTIKGSYANDLDSLLAMAPDRAALRARLAANTDMSTVVVAGDAEKFRVELNVRDARRTLVKVRGPVTPRRALGPSIPATPAPMNADGAPLVPAAR